MQVHFVRAFSDNYIWIIHHPNSSNFLSVDPGEAAPVIDYALQHQLSLSHILLTHHHFDHIGGVAALLDYFPDCRIYAPADSRIDFTNQSSLDIQQITIGSFEFNIMKTHGHTSSHISYYEAQHGWLFCGDTLFSAGCGRVFDGSLEQLYNSLEAYAKLPDDTLVFCAHEYTLKNLRFALLVEPDNKDIQNYINRIKNAACSLPSTISLEKKVNPFLRTSIPSVQNFALEHGAKSRDNLELFRVLRQEKDAF